MQDLFIGLDLNYYAVFKTPTTNLESIEDAHKTLKGISLLKYSNKSNVKPFEDYIILTELSPDRYLNLSSEICYTRTEYQQDYESLLDYIEKISIEKSLDLLEEKSLWEFLDKKEPSYLDLYDLTRKVFLDYTRFGLRQWFYYLHEVMGFDGIINPSEKKVSNFKPFQVLCFDKEYLEIIEIFNPKSKNILQEIDERL